MSQDSNYGSVFSNIYEKCVWGDNKCDSYKGSSGPGSSLEFNKTSYIPTVKNFIKTNELTSVVDLGCGDFRCGLELYSDLEIKYDGYDAYEKVINHNNKTFNSEDDKKEKKSFNNLDEDIKDNSINKENDKQQKYSFHTLDILSKKEEIKSADLCILKDVIQHWKLKDIYSFLDYLVTSKKFKYILICNCSHQMNDDTDINIGEFRPLNSEHYPLRKYEAKKLLYYNGKEISIISCI